MRLKTIGLLAVTGTAWLGCTHTQATSQEQRTSSAQEVSEKDLQGSVDEQKNATKAEQDAQAARDKVARDQQTLAADQADAEQKRAEADQMQAQAKSRVASYQREARASERSAETSQSEMPTPGTESQVAVGHVIAVQGHDVQVHDDPSNRDLHLKVGAKTNVLVDGRSAGFRALKEGDQVRASYTINNGLPTALKIEATTSSTTGPYDPPTDEP